jgi:catechol 2,3-dioxygenase-like lactoylglutathione lyase family enzyme
MTSKLDGVHHAAFVMWKPEETIRFYRDILGFPVIHCITAKGWGQEGHADFVHVFFDAGHDNVMAFFYYFGESPRDERSRDYIDNGRHTALRAGSRAELEVWRERLHAHGVNVSPLIEHEVIASIYFTDPNGYPMEITAQLRPFDARDREDAKLTIDAFLDAVRAGEDANRMWQRKGERVRTAYADLG